MDNLLRELNQKQILWFAKLVVALINIDQNISISENEILYTVFSYIKNGDNRKELVRQLEANNTPSLELTEGLLDSHLAATYIELIKVVIADTRCVEEEIKLLNEVAGKFGFEKKYHQQLISWCYRGVHWRQARDKFLPESLHKEYLQAPLPLMSEELKIWFVEAAIGAILAEGVVDIDEVDFLKMVVGSIKKDYEKKRLVILFRHKKPPFLKPPPRAKNEVIISMYMEIIKMIAINDIITREEVRFLKELCLVCKLNDIFFQQSLQWHRDGIEWKKAGKTLILECSFEAFAD